jgi:hypothetical protein
MINKPMKIEKIEKQDYPPIPEDIYQVQILDINVKEREKYKQPGVMEEVFAFQFTLLDGKDKDQDLRGRNVWDNFVPIYLYVGKNGKNKLWQIVEALIKREMTTEDESMIDSDWINAQIGKQLRISIIHKKSGDKTYDNVDRYYAAKEDLTPLTAEEIDTATVKKNEDDTEDTEINISDIPF